MDTMPVAVKTVDQTTAAVYHTKFTGLEIKLFNIHNVNTHI